MFQKTTFGANTSGYGTFSANAATSSPFGFKPATATSAFGATPAFGASPATQPTATGGLFGATSNTGGGLFGNTSAAPTSAFGATSSSFGGFGATPAPTGGLFSTPTTAGGLFGNTQNTSAFGAKPAGGFGFGATTASNTGGGGLFGGAAPAGGLFGQQPSNMSGGGLFSTNTAGAFGQQAAATGTGHVKYNPVTGTDVIVKNGTSQNVNIKHLCITCMKEYEGKCLEELRLEDYVAGRKGPSQAAFGGLTQTENKPLFGAGGFGQTPATSSQSVFGGGGLGTSTFGQTNAFSFAGNTQANTQSTGLFGAAKPAFGATSTAGTGLFGTTTTTQAAPAFGANTSTFGGFGNTTTQQTGGLFGAKPATTGAATTGFGGFGTSGGLFGAKPATATAAPAFGSTPLGGFGSTAPTGGIFGGGAFGKPTTTQPAFGLNQTPALGSSLGANSLQAKPTGFGTLGGGTMFQQPQNTNAFNTGLNTGLGGGGLFSNPSALGGGMGGLGGMNTNTGMMNGPNQLGVPTAVHEQILTVAARPYGGSNLFKDLLPETSNTTDDALLPTNPAAMKAALDKSQYKLTSPAQTIKLKPRQRHDKKSLFDGLEEADASLEDKLSLKPSRKRLVLRPNNTYNRENSEPNSEHNNRSLEERRENSFPSMPEREKDTSPAVPDKDRHIGNSEKEERRPFAENNHFDSISDRHGSWLSSPPPQTWNKEKHADIQPTPRIYPQLDKELPNQISERRASWLTTKPLRKPTVPGVDSENSVRELINHEAKRDQDVQKSRDRSLEASPDRLSLSEEEHAPPSKPHPAGIKLNRPGYYTIPSLEECVNYIRPDGRCVVPNFTIGRKNYGNVYFDCEMDVTDLDLDSLVHFLNKEVIIYPDDADKPPVGEGLNRRAIVTLDRIWPRDKTDRCTITSPERLLKMDYEGKLRRVCDKHDTKFIEYRPQTGSWVFRVEHFSKYGLTDSDEEDDITPEVMKRQIEHQQLQKATPISSLPPKNIKSGGLGGLSFIAEPRTLPGADSPPVAAMEDGMFASSLNIMNGTGKVSAYDMDTTENTELQSMYSDMERAFAVKSPTSELARLEHRHTHNVQLMKASLYADTEMEEDDTSVSTADQRVPTLGPAGHQSPPHTTIDVLQADESTVVEEIANEIPLKPLIVTPQTVVLQYHRKVPPFKQTIAGRLDAQYIADLRLCRSRHSRVGFGPGSSLAYVTSYDSVAELPKSADLCDIGDYLAGRSENDWSGHVVTNIQISSPELRQSTVKHIKALLEHSKSTPRERSSPLYSVEDRLGLLKKHVEISGEANAVPKFGVSSSYCHEIWKLCDALWGADLENGGVPGTDNQSIVHNYRQLLAWIDSAVAGITDRELAEAKTAEVEDEGDFHSSRIFSLLLGGRVLAACQLAAQNGDLNMCALIAQGAGDPTFRSLLSRQLSTWRECGATTLISCHRLASLQLLAGMPPQCLVEREWLAAFSATARYLCPQIPSLERIVRKFESLFHSPQGESETDITTLEDAATCFPAPDHLRDYDVEVTGDKKPRRTLDLRYELIRARAHNARPKLHPRNYSPDPLDYSLCFLVGSWLGSPSDEACASFSSQLEASGDWDLAVAVLCYISDDSLRAHLIRNVLSRHAPATPRTDEQRQQLLLVESLQLPTEWILIARADRAKYEHEPLVQAQHLVAAQQWGAAHAVLVDELMTDHVLNDKLESLTPILEKLNEAAGKCLVPGWEEKGKALYHYSIICREIQGVVNDAESPARPADVAAKLQSLRPHVIAACNSLAHYKPSSPVWSATLAAMAGALSQVSHSNSVLLRAPPDTRHSAVSCMVTELCERASEMCVEANNETSPVRS